MDRAGGARGVAKMRRATTSRGNKARIMAGGGAGRASSGVGGGRSLAAAGSAGMRLPCEWLPVSLRRPCLAFSLRAEGGGEDVEGFHRGDAPRERLREEGGAEGGRM